MKTAIIAEKPSVAREIATIIGATDRKDGYLCGNDYLVTWALGHLVGLSMPEAYGFKGFKRENLPILPETFILQPRQTKAERGYKADVGALKQLKVIKKVFDECDRIIVATDAGREGELIFRTIYNYLECSKPFKRLWISSLTEKAIREGLSNLKDGKEYDNLYYAAKARSEADWLVGINASQALTISAGDGVYSLGRVQTPTLAMICSRYKENKQFVSQKYWQLSLGIEKDAISFKAHSINRYDQKEEAEKIYELLKSNPQIEINQLEQKKVTEEAPLLYDLTGLQKKANNQFGYSADKTLSIAQTLYERKLITYPRTGSRYISDDVFEQIPELLKFIKVHPKFADYTIQLLKTNLNKQSVNDKKVTDHHALLITEIFARELNKEERNIYDLIVCRMLEAFSPQCCKELTSIKLSSNDIDFEAKGMIIKKAGWRAVQTEQPISADEKETQNSLIPLLEECEKLNFNACVLIEKQTKPKALHSESSLLATMETAGKDLEDETQRRAMKDVGLGTPATRASIIETLLSRAYIIRKEKSLVPTEKGLAIHGIVKTMRIANVEMTGMWEEALAKIEKGEYDAETFNKSIAIYTSQTTAELLSSKIVFKENQSMVCCPKCNEGKVKFYPMVVRCNSEDCDFMLFRSKAGYVLSEFQMTELLTKKKTNVIRGFKSRTGKEFDASLILNSEFEIQYVFPDKKKIR